jgi:hypothetical protein
MTEDTDRFFSKVREQHFWKFYEIKTCLFRPDINSDWLAIFLYARLLIDKVDTMKNLPSTDHFNLIHEVDEIHKLGPLLNQIREKEVKLQDIRVSLRLMTTQLNYEFYPKSYGLFGINEPSYGLSLNGKYPQEFEEVRRNIELELQNLLLPFENIMNAVHSLLGLDFWNFSYSPFVVVFAPIPIKIMDVKFTQESVAITLSCSNDAELEHLRLNLYPKDLQGKQYAQKPITTFTRYKNTESVTHSHTVVDKAAVYLKIVLLYENEAIEERIAEKTLAHLAKRRIKRG